MRICPATKVLDQVSAEIHREAGGGSGGPAQEVLAGPAVPRRLVELNPLALPCLETGVLVVGGGVGGLSAAIAASEERSTLVLLKGERGQSNTSRAQGGMAAAVGPDDSVEQHVQDTLVVGAGLAHEDVVRSVVEAGPDVVERWLSWGGQFDRTPDGELRLAMEGGHGVPRIVHANGDETGAEIQRLLGARASGMPKLSVRENVFVLDLVTDAEQRVRGVLAWSHEQGFFCVWAGATVLCTGGGGTLYRETTNPVGASADGVALAYRAGARVRDMEFVQFHPTVLYVAGMARFLVSETARGEGGVLLDREGHRFMPEYHPDAELAPRDVVARSIVRQLARVRDTQVFLDMTHLAAERIRTRFPVIHRACLEFGIDMTTDPVPVHPACHYFVGGVVTDVDGRTSLPGLYACGEAASSGFHGANRMGSNSLLEGAVIGHRAGLHAARSGVEPEPTSVGSNGEHRARAGSVDLADMDAALRSLMWRLVGIERDGTGLEAARDRLQVWNGVVGSRVYGEPDGWVLANKLLAGWLVAEAAWRRRESRGTHFRRDHDARDDSRWLREVVLERPVPP